MLHFPDLYVWLGLLPITFAVVIPTALFTGLLCWLVWGRRLAAIRREQGYFGESEDAGAEGDSLSSMAAPAGERASGKAVTKMQQQQRDAMAVATKAKEALQKAMAELEKVRRERDALKQGIGEVAREGGSDGGGDESEEMDAKAEVVELTEALRESEYEVSRLGTEIQLLRTIRTEFEALQNDNQDLEAMIDTLQVDKSALEDVVNALRMEKIELEDDFNTMRVKQRDQEERIESLSAKVEREGDARLGAEKALSELKKALPSESEGDLAEAGSREPNASGSESEADEPEVPEVESEADEPEVPEVESDAEEEPNASDAEATADSAPDTDTDTETADGLALIGEAFSLQGTPAASDPSLASGTSTEAEPSQSEAIGDQDEKEDHSNQSLLFFDEFGGGREAAALPAETVSEERAEPIESDGNEEPMEDDPVLGRIYKRPPTQADDLTKIKGVGRVIEGRLHEIGIFRYRQIALWTPEQVGAFSKQLRFRDRVERDQWIEQCQALHLEEYGEGVPGQESIDTRAS